MRNWLRSVLGQTTLALLAGIVLAHLLSLAIYAGERRDVVTGARAEAVARQVVAAAQLLGDTAVAERRRLAHSLRRPGLRLFWDRQPIIEGDDDGWPALPVRRALVAELGGQGGAWLRVGRRVPPGTIAAIDGDGEAAPVETRGRGRPGGGPMFGAADVVLGALRLDDGSFLNFAARFVPSRPLWATPAFSAALATTAVVLIVALWAVRRAALPLRGFAAAAERLGADINTPPVREEGPLEVARLARAFNRMQDRIQRLLRDRTVMLAAIAHDLRTPLTRLRLRAELIEDDEERRKSLADLDEMQAMLAEALALARDEASAEARQRLDLAALVQTVCAEWEDTGADVGYAGPAHLGFAGRPLGLKRAIANLIGNAVRYGGRARATLRADADGIVLDVDDDGPGIPAAELENVFRPFYRLDGSRSRQTGGAGLGLAVVRKVIVAHGGRVGLANRAEGGLRARVLLPAATVSEFSLSTPQRNSNGQVIA